MIKIKQTNYMKKSSFVFGATILTISGILCKVLGAIYKVPLANLLKTEGMGIYYLVFPIYSLFLTLSSTCFPSVISRMVAGAVADGKNKLAYKIFVASLIVLVFLGFVFGVILFVFSSSIASLQGVKNASMCYVLISPSILFVAIISAFRGYFQGLQNMLPTAVSQILEQIIKIAVGFLFSFYLLKYGIIYGVLGALLGVVVSEFFALCYIALYFVFYRKKVTKSFDAYEVIEEKIFDIIKNIFKTTIPFFLNNILFPISTVLDSFLIIKLLQHIGYEFSLASSVLGINNGIVNSIINLPVIVAVSIAMVIIPSISFSFKRGDDDSIEKKFAFATKVVFLISIPCIFIFVVYSKEIVSLLFSSSLSSSGEFSVAVNLLSVCSITVLYQSLLQIFVSVLQAINRAFVPVVSVSISIFLKTILQIIFFVFLKFDVVLSIGISSFICFFVSTLICFLKLKKEIKISLKFRETVLFPLIISSIVIVFVKVFLTLFYLFLPAKISILLAFFISGIMYLVMLFLFKVLDRQDLFLIKRSE